MSDPKLDPIDPGLDALLDAERGTQPRPERLGRVWSRLEGSIATGGPGAERAPTRTLSASVRGFAVHGLVGLAFVAGGVAGVGLHALLEKPPAERIVYVERPVPSAIAAARSNEASASPPTSAAPVAASQLPVVRPSVGRVSPPPSASSSLSAERALLDDARRALAQGDGALALSLASEHARRFAQPQLGEERETIAIQALILEGRYEEARARAARFRSASPNSLFLPAVDASLESIP